VTNTKPISTTLSKHTSFGSLSQAAQKIFTTIWRWKSGRTLERRSTNPDLQLSDGRVQLARGSLLDAVRRGFQRSYAQQDRPMFIQTTTLRRVDRLPPGAAVLFDERETSA